MIVVALELAVFDRRVGRSQIGFALFVSPQPHDFVAQLAVVHLAIRRHQEAVFVDSGIDRQARDQTDVRAFRRLNRTNAAVVRNVHVADFEAGAFAIQTTGTDPKIPLIFNSLAEDTTSSHEEALLRIYQRLRPGNPPQLEKARALFHEKFYDTNRYRLGRVGRFRINRKLKLNVPEDEMTLRPEDLIAAIKYLLQSARPAMPRPTSTTSITWAIAVCARSTSWPADELRKGFLKLRRTVQERMSLKDVEDMTPRSLINPKSISAAIEYFFGRGELSQVVDQTNPLSMLTHERRLSALGPGGLNRKRAGFEVRDVHISHYGRICPIETPEGTNIGLISSLAIYAGVDEYGFLITPYRKVNKGKLTDEVVWLRADEEIEAYRRSGRLRRSKTARSRATRSSPAIGPTSRWCRSTRFNTSTSRRARWSASRPV